MGNEFNISDWLSWICGVALLIISTIYCFRRDAPRFLRAFPFYCLANVLSEGIVFVYPKAQAIGYFIFTIIELLYFTFLLSTIVKSRKIAFMAWTLDIFFLIYLLFFVWRHRIIPFGMPEIVEAAILLPFSAMCYVGILTDAEAPEIRHLPTFWLVTGCLLYFMFLIPFVLISEYYSRIGKSELSRAIFSMNGIVLIACYFFYFKSITCWRTT